MKNISFFNNSNLFEAGTQFFNEVSIPLNTIEEKAFAKEDILQQTYNTKSEAHQLIDQVYLLGMTDDQSFTGERNFEDLDAIQNLTADYEGLLVIAVELKLRENKLLPTRSQLAEISRAFNREFMYTPVTILYRYGEYIALANSERSAYKAKYKEGEKVGKVSLLRDIRFSYPHTGHLQILQGLVIPAKITTFKDLYKHWTDVFSVNVLNKKFYQELSNWYFWAIKNVTFPGEPSLDDAAVQGKDHKDLLQEQKATNVIRMLTRLLFVWFMKEKKLIPEELFDLEHIKSDILNKITPYQEVGMFTEHNKESVYYKAILQNLFFATLNCPIKADSVDKRERGFRGDGYGTNRGIDHLMRYKKYFKNSDAFLGRVNEVVPFLNGGLFECLDDKFNNVYIDGFSDQMVKGEQLIVPDYLFFGLEEETDLSEIIGVADKKNKNAAVKGLINILKSYKFTITENTPIEEEIALDPELLGKVFENLLASYNPETKTTARKQTGSFYTPREIVNYMVDESLIAYLKNKIQSADTVLTELGKSQAKLFGDEGKVGQTSLMAQHSGSELKDNENLLDNLLHNLVSYNTENPFDKYPQTSKIILEHLDTCTILDPACGSGAFPMGILQKMVHILHKLDPDNRIWKEVQIDKAKKQSDEAFDIADKNARENRLIEINEAFDLDTNNPDYARKLFLIENCIYGVDIQPIATQISKLRFFISLVVEQNVNKKEVNFGIRPLPNLETKFVAANTLVSIEKENTLFSTDEIRQLEQKLKQTRNKLFGARSKETKLKYRELDKNLRFEIANKLKKQGFPTTSAEKLASWDPFDQNTSSSFFDAEWMFDIKGGFDIVIGNPPYIGEKGNELVFHKMIGSDLYKRYYTRWMDYFYYFFHFGLDNIKSGGILSYITTNYYFTSTGGLKLREDLKKRGKFYSIVDFNELRVFESAKGQHNCISILKKTSKEIITTSIVCNTNLEVRESHLHLILNGVDNTTTYSKIKSSNIFDGNDFQIRIKGISGDNQIDKILDLIKNKSTAKLGEKSHITMGVVTLSDTFSSMHSRNYPQIKADKGDGIYVLNHKELESLDLNVDSLKNIIKPFFKNSDIYKYGIKTKNDLWLIYLKDVGKPILLERNLSKHFDRFSPLIKGLKENFLKNEIAAAVVKKWFRNGNYFVLFTPKKEHYFSGEKIVFPYRSKSNIFSYSSSDFFGSKDIGYILQKEFNYKLKYLLAVLNSKLMFVWLYNRGKRKGETLELYTKPLQDIPIVMPTKSIENILIFFSDVLSYLNQTRDSPLSIIDEIVDGVIFELYFTEHLEERKLSISSFVEKDIFSILGEQDFDRLGFTEKEIVTQLLSKCWSDPNNEVAKRVSQFKEKSPDILKIILES